MEGCDKWELRYSGGSSACWSQCVAVMVCGNRRVWESRRGGVPVWGIRSEGGLIFGAVAVLRIRGNRGRDDYKRLIHYDALWRHLALTFFFSSQHMDRKTDISYHRQGTKLI